MSFGGACSSVTLREVGVEFFGQDHRDRGVDALPHLDLRHHQRRLAGVVDADEGVGRELAGGVVRRLHRLVDAARTGRWNASRKPPARPPVSSAAA